MPILRVPVTADDHICGKEDALITLLEYGDYECSTCRLAYPMIKQLKDFFGDKLRFVYRHFPLTEIHPFAESAAEAAEFANLYHRFWQVHERLSLNQKPLSIPFLIELGKEFNLPDLELEKVLAEKPFELKIHKDFVGGMRSGVNGIPTFYINNNRYNGTLDFETISKTIESLLHTPAL